MNNIECVVGIPKNQRLKDDVKPILDATLELEDCKNGVWRSPFIENARFVEMKIRLSIQADLPGYLWCKPVTSQFP